MLNHAANLGVVKTAPAAPRASRAGHDIGQLGLIWAQDRSGLLGANGGMLWHVPADFKHFKETTMGWPVISGRASFEALGGALPGRRNIVLTHSPDFEARGAEVARSLDEALEMCRGTEEVWITGGGRVYQDVLDADLADLLVVTELDFAAAVPPDAELTKAPVIDPNKWQLDKTRSDVHWRTPSGDGAWKVLYFIPRQ